MKFTRHQKLKKILVCEVIIKRKSSNLRASIIAIFNNNNIDLYGD